MKFFTLDGRPRDLSMTRTETEELLAKLEGWARTEPKHGPVGGMFRDQAELVRGVLEAMPP